MCLDTWVPVGGTVLKDGVYLGKENESRGHKPHGVGGPSVFLSLSLVNKDTTLGLLIGQKLGKQGRKN